LDQFVSHDREPQRPPTKDEILAYAAETLNDEERARAIEAMAEADEELAAQITILRRLAGATASVHDAGTLNKTSRAHQQTGTLALNSGEGKAMSAGQTAIAETGPDHPGYQSSGEPATDYSFPTKPTHSQGDEDGHSTLEGTISTTGLEQTVNVPVEPKQAGASEAVLPNSQVLVDRMEGLTQELRKLQELFARGQQTVPNTKDRAILMSFGVLVLLLLLSLLAVCVILLWHVKSSQMATSQQAATDSSTEGEWGAGTKYVGPPSKDGVGYTWTQGKATQGKSKNIPAELQTPLLGAITVGLISAPFPQTPLVPVSTLYPAFYDAIHHTTGGGKVVAHAPAVWGK
jgi:hypothetical protein